jgi:hypothetical protein
MLKKKKGVARFIPHAYTHARNFFLVSSFFFQAESRVCHEALGLLVSQGVLGCGGDGGGCHAPGGAGGAEAGQEGGDGWVKGCFKEGSEGWREGGRGGGKGVFVCVRER